MRTLYLECESGISGDMSVAALIDLGADRKVLMRALDSISDLGFDIEISDVNKSHIRCTDFHVSVHGTDSHDHDMEYLYGHERGHEHGEHGEHGHEHCEHGEHNSEHEHGHHGHRGLSEIVGIIERTDATTGARGLAKKIFGIIAEAEAEVHNIPIDEVHFHEVGAVDSIVDIIAFSVCYDNLAIERTIIPSMCEGRGTIRCRHGILPIPVPAVVKILEHTDLSLNITDTAGELITPTGAAIAAAIVTDYRLPRNMRIKKTGLGAGKRQYDRPGILRAMFVEEEISDDCIVKLETDIDDCSGEVLGYTMERLYAAGAREVHYMPIFMKKNRPAYELVVICGRDKVSELSGIIFAETTTIGIRRSEMERTVLPRECVSFESSLGTVTVKLCKGAELECYPEYESLKKLCGEHNISYRQAYDIISRETREWLATAERTIL